MYRLGDLRQRRQPAGFLKALAVIQILNNQMVHLMAVAATHVLPQILKVVVTEPIAALCAAGLLENRPPPGTPMDAPELDDDGDQPELFEDEA